MHRRQPRFNAGVKYNIYGVKKEFECLLAIMRCARSDKFVPPPAARGRGSFASLCISRVLILLFQYRRSSTRLARSGAPLAARWRCAAAGCESRWRGRRPLVRLTRRPSRFWQFLTETSIVRRFVTDGAAAYRVFVGFSSRFTLISLLLDTTLFFFRYARNDAF